MADASLSHSHSQARNRRPRAAVLLLVLQFAAMWGAFFILAPAIDWPASLDEPPRVILPLILDRSGAVFAGYLSYLVHALALIPLAVLLGRALALPGPLATMAVAVGVLAGFAKALGITRWLFLMPGLAEAWVDPAATEAERAAIGIVYEAFNAYAGGVGELMGVGLFAGAWTLLLAWSLVRQGAALLGWSGVVASMLLFSTLLSVAGLESPLMLTLSGVLWQFWTLALAIRLYRHG